MKKYTVDISPDAKKEFLAYLERAAEFGDSTAANPLDALDCCIDTLETAPNAGFERMQYIPSKYKMIHLWKHYWAIFQIYEEDHNVKIEYIIDDRQNYGAFVH